jgi:hypothetical protein
MANIGLGAEAGIDKLAADHHKPEFICGRQPEIEAVKKSARNEVKH